MCTQCGSGVGEFRELHVGDDIVGFRKSWHDRCGLHDETLG